MIFDKENYEAFDTELWQAIHAEEVRQQNNIELIASENVVSKAVMAAQGTVLTNKYAKVILANVIMAVLIVWTWLKIWLSNVPKNCLVLSLPMFNRIQEVKLMPQHTWL